MQGNIVYIRSKVVRPFSEPYASRSYMHPAALYSASGICAIHFTITYSLRFQIVVAVDFLKYV
jgi:hypothetical protein